MAAFGTECQRYQVTLKINLLGVRVSEICVLSSDRYVKGRNGRVIAGG